MGLKSEATQFKKTCFLATVTKRCIVSNLWMKLKLIFFILIWDDSPFSRATTKRDFAAVGRGIVHSWKRADSSKGAI